MPVLRTKTEDVSEKVEEAAEQSGAAETQEGEETWENEYWFGEDGDLVEAKKGTYKDEFQYLADAVGDKVTGKIAEKCLKSGI